MKKQLTKWEALNAKKQYSFSLLDIGMGSDDGSGRQSGVIRMAFLIDDINYRHRR
jgi:hypothetical protein